MIYGIIGSKGHGKDTLAKYIQKYDNSFVITHFADPLKNMLMKIFPVSHDQLYTSRKEELFLKPINIDDYVYELSKYTKLDIKKHGLIAKSPRELLQYVGTDYIRSENDQYWVNEFLVDNFGKDNLLCADLRFSNEADAFRNIGALLIRIHKKGQKAIITHESEEFSGIKPDYNLYVDDGALHIIDFAGFLLARGYLKTFKLYSYLSGKINNKWLVIAKKLLSIY